MLCCTRGQGLRGDLVIRGDARLSVCSLNSVRDTVRSTVTVPVSSLGNELRSARATTSAFALALTASTFDSQPSSSRRRIRFRLVMPTSSASGLSTCDAHPHLNAKSYWILPESLSSVFPFPFRLRPPLSSLSSLRLDSIVPRRLRSPRARCRAWYIDPIPSPHTRTRLRVDRSKFSHRYNYRALGLVEQQRKRGVLSPSL